ncbi:MAG: deoxyguanosinetriphosphate triphosphohydrolase [Anaerolineales bacterium]|nr:deoxyguanosinetriphosphate triphosphohydrolase [Anaerolineales bacterium]
MLFKREKREELEDQSLAPYGIRSQNSKGMEYPDSTPIYRTVFQRDRDRILHTTAFRRLEYKTQVFLNTEGDYYRTRLTHTLEVAQIGRTVARALGANEDLEEAICLAHDLGHSPFGHSGERILNELMKNHGGFDHNKQSLRIVTKLEKRFQDFPGLNLTWETREGIVKHETEYDVSDAEDFDPDLRGHLEAQIANAADELAYSAHDLDDGLRSGLISTSLLEELALWKILEKSINWKGGDLNELDRKRIIRRMIGIELEDLLKSTAQAIEESGVTSVEGIQKLPHNVIRFSDQMDKKNRELKDFLFENLYQNHRVIRMQVKAERIICDLFSAYQRDPLMLPKHIQSGIDKKGLEQSICDYVAGMTDRFAIDEHQKLFDPSQRP